ncbi:hypothetical protein PITCH_A1070025 [uncultured Desulfobacterium sp.]|uniref:Uncharacterized protein n=1 Tax=uncultured Desulfobacterium sp. TaxID=201089 RepID=A0A445MQX2_9BACT|nr:hypothetical protein PITCH_A1070025 [uncultured Desulfobacterium sp.]
MHVQNKIQVAGSGTGYEEETRPSICAVKSELKSIGSEVGFMFNRNENIFDGDEKSLNRLPPVGQN